MRPREVIESQEMNIFFKDTFKENPVFPASIMIEALGQLCVFFLLKGKNAALKEKVDPSTIFFTSCDGVKCRRICKPGDLLKMKVKVSRIRHPLACFLGEIAVEGEKTASAEEIKLAFDYYPVIDGQSEDAISHSNGNGSRPSSLTDKDSERIRSGFSKVRKIRIQRLRFGFIGLNRFGKSSFFVCDLSPVH